MDVYLSNILFIIVGMFFIMVSAFIYRKKSLGMIEAYDNKKNYYEKKLLIWTSVSFLVASIIIIINSIIGLYYRLINSGVFFGIIVAILAIVIGIGFSKYEIN